MKRRVLAQSRYSKDKEEDPQVCPATSSGLHEPGQRCDHEPSLHVP